MRSLSLPTLALLALFSLSTVAQGQSVLEQLPADATGFVVVHNLAATSEKIERVTTIFAEFTSDPLPAPLTMALGATGMGPGLDQKGDALLAILPSNDAPLAAQPLLLLPVADYEAFAEAIGGDLTGELCHVTIAEETVLLAKRGSYAALMNVEHRERFEQVLAATSAAPAELKALEEWLATTDVAAGLTRSGVERLTALARRNAADARQAAAGAGDSPELRQLQQTMQELDGMLQFFGAEVQAGALGLTIDGATNVKLAKRVILSKAGSLASLAEGKPLAQSPLSKFASGPFVIAGGGPLPADFGASLARGVRRFIETLPKGQGYEGLQPQDWEKLEQSYRESVAGLTSVSFVLRPGDKEEGLLSNYFIIAETADSGVYLASFQKSFELSNEVMQAAKNDLSLPFELYSTEITDQPSVIATADAAAAAADPNVPGVDPLIKTLVGADGKMRIYAVTMEERAVLIGSATREQLAGVVRFPIDGGESLAKEWPVDSTTRLLDPAASWTMLVSPQGLVAWISRGAQTWAATFGGDLKIPPFPATPPIGLSLNVTDGQLHGELVAPKATLEGLADYLIQLEAM